ncbi:hypothetical protein ACFL2U_03075 [Patescibacteria group bacterium]
MPENFEQPIPEKELRKYIYWDQSKKPREIIFECNARGILEADKLYEKETGNDPEKQNYVGCEVGAVVEE